MGRDVTTVRRHLADYVLVWAGDRETDLRISAHFARIGNSVFPDICGPKDPTCSKYSAYPTPTPMMRALLGWKRLMAPCGGPSCTMR